MNPIMLPCRHMIRILPRLLMLTALSAIVSGCGDDGECKCNGPAKALIYISVEEGPDSSSDFNENEDIDVDNATVLIYDKDANLQRIVKLSREQIDNRTAIEIPIYKDNLPQVVVWGNLNGSEDVSGGIQLSSALVSMKQKGAYALPTDNLFYGFKQLTDESKQEIVITSWVAQVFITARGIESNPDNASNYYFTIESSCSSYDFYGRPQAGKAIVKVDAETQIYHQEVVLVHQPVNVVACPDISGEQESMVVKLYKRTPEGDVLMASANTDTEGNCIITHTGENTNVLLHFTNNETPTVYFMLTPWEHIYQWSWW